MKKNYLLYFVLGLLLLNVAVACGGENEPDPEEPTEENDSYPVGNTAYDRDWSYGPDDGYCTGPYKAVVHILNVDEVDTIFVKLINIAAYTDYTFPCLSDRVWLNKHDLGEKEVHLYDTVHFYITAIKYWGAYITSACSFYCIVKPLNEGETTDTINWRY